MAITSTVASVYMLLVITLERIYTIMTALHMRRIPLTVVYSVIIAGWALAILIGILPLVGVSAYSSIAICLPFDVSTVQAKVYVTFILLCTGLAFTIIVVCYAVLFYTIYLSPSRRRLQSSSSLHYKTWKREIKVVIRMSLLSFTNIAAWFPIAFLALTAAYGRPLLKDVSASKFFIVFVFPINSCLNPVLYSFSTKVFQQNFRLLASKLGLLKCCSYCVQLKHDYTPSSTSHQGARSQRSTVVSRFFASFVRVSSSSESSTNRGVSVTRPSIDDGQGLLQLSEMANDNDNGSSVEPLAAYHWVSRRSSNFSDSSNEEPLQIKFVLNGRPGSATNPSGSDREQDEAESVFLCASGLPGVPEETEHDTLTPSHSVNCCTAIQRQSCDGAVEGSAAALPRQPPAVEGYVSNAEGRPERLALGHESMWERESMKDMALITM